MDSNLKLKKNFLLQSYLTGLTDTSIYVDTIYQNSHLTTKYTKWSKNISKAGLKVPKWPLNVPKFSIPLRQAEPNG
jgi:hypothetical protein